MVEGETWLPQIVVRPPHVSCGRSIHTTHTLTWISLWKRLFFFFFNDNVETGSVAKRMVSMREVPDPITSAKI